MLQTSNSPFISIKLLIDQERNRVGLAEAGTDFIDILRSIFTFPLGNIARLFRNNESLQPGCLNNLYNSVENLSLNSFRTDACKSMLLYPRSIHEDKFKSLKLNLGFTVPTQYFVCEKRVCRRKPVGWLSYYRTARCSCWKLMNKEAILRVKKNVVKDETAGESTFFITDDLRKMQGLPGDLIQSLPNFGIKNVSLIEEKVLEIGSARCVIF
ncbi:DUF674 family protein [Gossypium australe]|uniref:DUF674 family protein n=1 Tax=Gossypium australe TaxID=47621 RepID=A0A5B6V6K1_9ROSI|nr:DUF674 family protein [Gossypium australe]